MTNTALVGLLLVAGVGWYWFDAMRALETARRAGRQRCEALGAALLDDTVVLVRLRPQRDDGGRLALWREYQFELSRDGVTRTGGEVVLLGGRVLSVTVEPRETASV